ncbi:phosphodiester glycosidase family protein [Thermodesulfobacteriota bacterium]
MKIDDGLFVGEFDLPEGSIQWGEKMIILKISPEKYSFKLLCASEQKIDGLTVKEWCKKYGMTAGINAGMFLPDRKTNVGYMKNFSHHNNQRINPKYHSVAAFNPVNTSRPLFMIFDSDEKDIRIIIKDYNTVVQNLRLIKRPGKNRWSRQQKKWSEAALGQDKDGNVLFIFSQVPLSMYEFNRYLLKLPIGITTAQHLEGGAEASLYLSHGGREIDISGSLEAGFNGDHKGSFAFSVPNVIGVIKSAQ